MAPPVQCEVTDFFDGVVTGESGDDDARDFSRATFDVLVPEVGVGARHCRAECLEEDWITVCIGELRLLKGRCFGPLQSINVGMVRRGQRGTTLQIELGKANQQWPQLWQEYVALSPHQRGATLTTGMRCRKPELALVTPAMVTQAARESEEEDRRVGTARWGRASLSLEGAVAEYTAYKELSSACSPQPSPLGSPNALRHVR